MGRSNANRAQQKRERNAKAAAGAAGGKSQLKTNEAAKNVKCKICMQTFMGVCSYSNLKEHSDNKHAKLTFEQCFPEHPGPDA